MALRSFYGARGSILHVESSSRKHFIVSKSLHWSGSVERRILKQPKQSLHIKASQNASNMTPNAGTSQKTSTASSQKKNLQISPFPNGFQTLVEEVCDQTSVVELELKTDVSGEVFKILYNDGEAVGYGDPLIAVLPYSTA